MVINCEFEGINTCVFSISPFRILNAQNCKIVNNPGNVLYAWGGYDESVQVNLKNCIIQNNGGGLYCSDYEVFFTMDSCLYTNNSSGFSYDPVYFSPGDISISNCTFTNNLGTVITIDKTENARISLNNLIISDNSSVGVSVHEQSISHFQVNCSDVYKNLQGDYFGIPDQTGVNGNISTDPMFCDSSSGDYHINAISPCAPDYNSCGILMGTLDIGCYDYICGDVNSDGFANVSDVVYVVNFAFSGGAPPVIYASGDVNCDGLVNSGDAVDILNYVFVEGNKPCDLDEDGIPDC